MDLKWNEKKFYNIYPDVDTFVNDMGKYGIPKNLLDEDYFPTCEICGNRFIHYEGNWIKGQHVCQICSQEKSIWEDYKEE